jgi:hypothetical protein
MKPPLKGTSPLRIPLQMPFQGILGWGMGWFVLKRTGGFGIGSLADYKWMGFYSIWILYFKKGLCGGLDFRKPSVVI